MKKPKPITPYARLLEEIKKWAFKVRNRHKVQMWMWEKAKLAEGWRLDSLHERIRAAEQLGYEVTLTANDQGLYVWYVKKQADTPYEWQ